MKTIDYQINFKLQMLTHKSRLSGRVRFPAAIRSVTFQQFHVNFRRMHRTGLRFTSPSI